MHPTFTLTPALTTDDFDVFGALLRDYAAHDLDAPHTSSIWQDLTDLPARYGSPHGLALLARQGDSVAGCAAFAATAQPGVVEFKRIFVKPSWRGMGLARQLTQALLDQARAAGHHMAVISTWSHNTSAIGLYKSLGFEPVAAFKTHPNPRLIYLGLPLSTPNLVSTS